ncbi:MAG TPA: type II secretion system F family protein [Bryobacteraceae bacterium]|nr:type II secretion system F family protein [Bryobacteraceae bacterium]
MAILVATALFLFLAGSIFALGYFRFVKTASPAEQIGVAADPRPVFAPGTSGSFEKVVTSLQWMGEKMPISPQTASMTRRLLMGAGFRQNHALTVFFGLKVVLCAVLLVLALVLRGNIANPILSMLAPLGAVAVGYLAPNLILDLLINRRQKILRLSLPDALDLMVVCTEAGLGLDQAVRVVSRELEFAHKEISDELSLVSLEMRAGTRRAEALMNFGRRTGEPEIKKLVSLLVQSDRFGTSIGDALRTHSDFMRVRRRQDAEERANKIGVKLIFPIFFLILPSIMLVALGPALIQLHKNLLPLLRDVNFK